jgi:hypothetical protein
VSHYTQTPTLHSFAQNIAAISADFHTHNYTVAELAREWKLSTDKIRELFRNEPGVIKLKDDNADKKRKRRYVSLRIPPEVARRVAKRIS